MNDLFKPWPHDQYLGPKGVDSYMHHCKWFRMWLLAIYLVLKKGSKFNIEIYGDNVYIFVIFYWRNTVLCLMLSLCTCKHFIFSPPHIRITVIFYILWLFLNSWHSNFVIIWYVENKDNMIANGQLKNRRFRICWPKRRPLFIYCFYVLSNLGTLDVNFHEEKYLMHIYDVYEAL